jgi:hypothetical protein
MESAEKIMDETQSRYGQKIPADSPEMAAARDRLAAVAGRVDQAASAADAAAADKAQAESLKQAQSREWMEKFSVFLDPKSDSYLRMGSDLHTASEADQELSRRAYERANALVREYQATDFPHGKTQELLFMEPGLLDTLRYYNEGEARANREKACAEWVEKLRQYADVGAGSRKYLVTGVTLSEGDIAAREALLKEAAGVWAEYLKVDFPLGKTPELLDLETAMKEKLAAMPGDLRTSRALLAGDLAGELDRVLSYLNQDTGWRSDTSKMPNLVMDRDVKPLEEALERYAGTVGKDDATLAGLRSKLALIRETDGKNRQVRSERTFMAPERYAGQDRETLRRTVSSIAGEKGAEVLRVSLTAEDWKEEDVLEWTDTTKTSVRRRITRFMAAQAATRNPDGRVYLNGVHLAMDRRSDGSWGALYGHVTWSDWMAEGNVTK